MMKILKKRLLSISFSTSLSILAMLLLTNSTITCAETPSENSEKKETEKYKPYQYPKIDYRKVKNPEQVKRGEYLAKMGDCIACHTTQEDPDQPFSGGLAIETPFGTIYSHNITPHTETGIGGWTNEEFIDAMKHGIAPDGSYYFPVFPYPNFNKLSDEDVIAIKAYLDAVPAVNKPTPKPDMPIPFRWRKMQFFWRVLFFYPNRGEFEPNPEKNDEWNRGAFIVQGLGHCGMCHTPLNFMGSPKHKYHLSGGFVDGYYAPQINKHRLQNVAIDNIVDVFKYNKRLEGDGQLVGPMEEVNKDSLVYLTDKDLKAMAIYLKDAPGKPLPRKKSSNVVSLKVGKKIYNSYCAGCHASGAGGAPKTGDVEAWAPKIALGIDTLHQNALNGIGEMPRMGGCSVCADSEVISAVDYIVAESKEGASTTSSGYNPVAKRKPTPPPNTSVGKGKEVYEKYCSACHETGKYNAPVTGDKKVWAPIITQGMNVLLEYAVTTYPNFPGFEGTDASIIAATKYMVEQSKTSGDYRLW